MYLGWVSTVLSKTNLAAVSWSVSTPIELIWTGTTTAPVALHLNGNGNYGGSNGMLPPSPILRQVELTLVIWLLLVLQPVLVL